MRLGKAGAEPQRPLVTEDRLCDPPLRPQYVAEVVVSLRVIRPELQSTLVSGDRLCDPALHSKGDAQVDVGAGVLRLEAEGLLVGDRSLREPPQTIQSPG
jgi:hypothetical protein